MKETKLKWVSLGFGVFFVALALLAATQLPTAPHPWWGLVFVFVLGGLGVEHIVATLKNKRSWLTRIGPLP